jgi:CRP-like cAMP-binding protein
MSQFLNSIRALCTITELEAATINEYFTSVHYPKNSYFLKIGQYCRKVAFVDKGALVYIQNTQGKENVCDFAFEGNWSTQYKSLTTNTPSEMSIQAVEDSVLIETTLENLEQLALKVPKANEIRMKLAEASFIEIAQRSVDMANLSADQRYIKLMNEKPGIFHRLPLSYIASYLGVTQRHLSRLRATIK